MVGFCALVAKPSGPVHDQAISFGLVVTDKLIASVGQIGLLLVAEQGQLLIVIFPF